MSGKLGVGVSYASVTVEVSASAATSSKVQTKTHNIVATMQIMRYYSSVREEISPLTPNSWDLLERQDYVGFFKACGPNYVRSIRRAQEVSAVFKFESSNRETATQFGMALKVSHPVLGSAEAKMSKSNKFKSVNSSLTIKILGFGMGLNQEGSGALVATTLQEFNQVMKFSFRSMTQNEDSHNIGMVYGMEVVPWVNNLAFQAAAQITDEIIIIPLPRRMIPLAYHKSDTATYPVFIESQRDDFRCKSTEFRIDKYGLCCEPEQLYDPIQDIYPEPLTDADLTICVCKPEQNLDKTLVKENMSNNGEFVARIDAAMRYKMNQLSYVEKCISAVHGIPTEFHFYRLKSLDLVYSFDFIDIPVSVMHLKMAIDPLGDYGMIAQLGREMDEWVEMFLEPCFAALFGSNIGSTPDVDFSYFMAYPWYNHPECMKLTCVAPNMRWDRSRGGCVPSFITGIGAPGYADGDEYCAKSLDDEYEDDAEEVCTYNTTTLSSFHTRVQNCWNSTNALTGIDYLIKNYCNPQLTGDRLSDEDKTYLEGNITASCV